MIVCDKEKCTACGACINICPKGCISFENDIYGVETAVIDNNECISCGLCQKVCPNKNYDMGNLPFKCYSAWSNDEKTRLEGASGGVASELYKYECENKGNVVGVSIDGSGNAGYSLTKNLNDIERFKNSKYIYSDMNDVYSKIYDALAKEETVTFVGLPCQVAGLTSFLKLRKVSTDRLFTVDLVCHGAAPTCYLNEHIAYLEKKYKHTTSEIFFRDPQKETHSYAFTLKENNKPFYSKKVYRNDTYQEGYHSGIIYRENCYTCRYAKIERQGDITLADFSGVGSVKPCDYSNKNVSCILVNTKKGLDRINELYSKGRIFLEERPIEEEINTEKQLSRPTPISDERVKFLKFYSSGLGFEKSVRKAAKFRILKNEIRYCLHIKDIKKVLRAIKNILKGSN